MIGDWYDWYPVSWCFTQHKFAIWHDMPILLSTECGYWTIPKRKMVTFLATNESNQWLKALVSCGSPKYEKFKYRNVWCKFLPIFWRKIQPFWSMLIHFLASEQYSKFDPLGRPWQSHKNRDMAVNAYLLYHTIFWQLTRYRIFLKILLTVPPKIIKTFLVSPTFHGQSFWARPLFQSQLNRSQ